QLAHGPAFSQRGAFLPAEIAIRDHAEQVLPVHDHQVAEALALHERPRAAGGVVGTDTDDVRRHDFLQTHGGLLAPRMQGPRRDAWTRTIERSGERWRAGGRGEMDSVAPSARGAARQVWQSGASRLRARRGVSLRALVGKPEGEARGEPLALFARVDGCVRRAPQRDFGAVLTGEGA